LYRPTILSTLAIAVFAAALWNSRAPVRPPGLPKNAKPLNWLRELGRIDPPLFDGTGLPNIEEDAELQFQATMAFYRRGAYALAIPGLRETLAIDSRAVGARFYLGICLVMIGEVEQGEQALEDTIAWGDTPYREAALYYGAKANLLLYRASRAHAMLLDEGKSLPELLMPN
jgi:tetratricopeptide (TPR) repeat protein